MVIPEDICECRTNDYPDFVRDPRKASEMALVSRDTGQMACKDARQLVLVIVDMREFRSEIAFAPSPKRHRYFTIIMGFLGLDWPSMDGVSI
jgi:hypothetical protein